MFLYMVYSKIQAMIKTFLDPILVDISKDSSDASNHRPLDEAVSNMPGRDLQKHLHDCIKHSLLNERELKQAKETMVSYVFAIAT